jgi:hypothetical protein
MVEQPAESTCHGAVSCEAAAGSCRGVVDRYQSMRCQNLSNAVRYGIPDRRRIK